MLESEAFFGSLTDAQRSSIGVISQLSVRKFLPSQSIIEQAQSVLDDARNTFLLADAMPPEFWDFNHKLHTKDPTVTVRNALTQYLGAMYMRAAEERELAKVK